MAMNPREFLSEKRKRLVGSILGHCEGAEWYDELTRAEQAALRQKVLDSVASFYDDVLDVIKALDGPDTGITNAAVWEFLERIHAEVQQRSLPTQADARTG